ncbi:type II toxin-antitoxin system HicA family toxin [Xenorhabdus sp. XENO-1]|uniref:type II toxin-antitoxin system HicA family toxin n=1 Tax=Xenorhabdus bovienii TaxID=40576 RepID=UPI0020CA28C0|nr:type II toxin-antitoxin system HicA family toxin [Xenorhabdus bovienii]MCP9270176.1 type II toxin-antitoxin system HicA family toxin [Xenorhabdus bovienii subsp. africana]
MILYRLTPLKYKEVVIALRDLGFEIKPKKGTSHEQWIKKEDGYKWVVTVDKHHAPFSRDLIKSMAKQAGMDYKKFHSLCKGNISHKEVLAAGLSRY